MDRPLLSRARSFSAASKEGKKIREDERRTKEQGQKRKRAMREEGEPRAVRVGGRSGFSGAEDAEAWSSGYTSSSGGRRQDRSPVGEKANPKRGHGERSGGTDEPSVKWTEEGGWGDKPGGSNHREWATRASRGLSA